MYFAGVIVPTHVQHVPNLLDDLSLQESNRSETRCIIPDAPQLGNADAYTNQQLLYKIFCKYKWEQSSKTSKYTTIQFWGVFGMLPVAVSLASSSFKKAGNELLSLVSKAEEYIRVWQTSRMRT